MPQTLVNFRMDSALKAEMEHLCQELGMNLTTAFTVFAKKMTRERRIPFEVSADPFYAPENQRYLSRALQSMNNGEGVEHELLPDEEN